MALAHAVVAVDRQGVGALVAGTTREGMPSARITTTKGDAKCSAKTLLGSSQELSMAVRALVAVGVGAQV